jgi:hypothetical protein
MKTKQMHIGATIFATLAAITALQEDFNMITAVSALILASVAVAFLMAAERFAHSTGHHAD